MYLYTFLGHDFASFDGGMIRHQGPEQSPNQGLGPGQGRSKGPGQGPGSGLGQSEFSPRLQQYANARPPHPRQVRPSPRSGKHCPISIKLYSLLMQITM